MEIIVKVTDDDLDFYGWTLEELKSEIIKDFACTVAANSKSIEVINTDDAKRAIKTTKDKHLAIINNSYEG